MASVMSASARACRGLVVPSNEATCEEPRQTHKR
jgi:hypothetical protein